MAGEIQIGGTTFATETSGTVTVSNVDSATNRTNLGLGSIATQAADSIDINGGAIDGTTIGGTSAAAGTFTTFTSTGIDDNASSTAITIDSSGQVGLGETTPASNLHLTSGGPVLSVTATNNSSGLRINSIGGTGGYVIRFQSDGSTLAGVTLEGISYANSFNTGSVTIEDNAVASISPPSGYYGGIFMLTAANSTTSTPAPVSGIIYFDCGNTSLLTNEIAVVTTYIVTTTGALSSGHDPSTDGKVTVSVQNTSGNTVQIKNALGSSATFYYTFFT